MHYPYVANYPCIREVANQQGQGNNDSEHIDQSKAHER